jgi:hypothetical protein
MAMVQLGLHSKCCNKCDFCTVEENNLNQIDDILVEIERAKENIKFIHSCEDNWTNKYSDGISLLGGEIFFIKDERYKQAILELVDVIIEYILKPSKDKNCRFSTVTNGMYDPEWLLFPVIDKIVNSVGIQYVDVNFSYDFKYRFKNDSSKKLCEDTINAFHKRYNYMCGIQMIVTQDVVDMYLNGWRTTDTVNELFPGNMITFLYPHPIHRGNNYAGIKNLERFNFSRNSFLKFLSLLKIEEPKVFESFLYSTRNSAVFKYTMMYEKMSSGSIDQYPRLSDGKEIINKNCNHSVLYKCYSDTEKCMLCDLEGIYL